MDPPTPDVAELKDTTVVVVDMAPPPPPDVAPPTPDVSPDTPPPPAKIAFIVQDPNGLGTGDEAIRQRMVLLGHTVTLVDDASAAPPAANHDLFFISWSSVASVVLSKYADIAKPVIVADPASYDDMKMTGTGDQMDWGWSTGTTVSITDGTHPLAAAFAGTVNVALMADNIGWGVPGAAAKKVASASGKTAIFAYEKGDALVGGGTAAARRVGFFTSDTLVPKLSADGWKLFDAAVSWALGR